MSWEFYEEIIQSRSGQRELEELAQDHKTMKISKLKYDHALVSKALKDRRKKEDGPQYTCEAYFCVNAPGIAKQFSGVCSRLSAVLNTILAHTCIMWFLVRGAISRIKSLLLTHS